MRELHKKWRPQAVLIEEAGTAIGLIEELKYDVLGLIPVKPDRDKIARMAVASAQVRGRQYLSSPRSSPGLPALRAELFAFPGSRYDDQCDSVSQAINDARSPNLIVWIKAYAS